MRATHTYTVYGLSVRSDVELPELVPTPAAAGDVASVTVRLGEVPTALPGATARGVLYQSNDEAFLLDMRDVARYLVTSGDTIVIQPYDGVSAEDVRVFLLGSCFGALLHQRGLFVLHAAVFATHDGAVALAGNSGAGKSTLLGTFLQRGYPMMVDDVCAVQLVDGVPYVLAGYPRTRLWSDALQRLGLTSDGLTRTRSQLDKFERSTPEAFQDRHLPLRHVFTLHPHNGDQVEVRALPPARRFATLLQHTYRRRFLKALGQSASHFRIATVVARDVPVSVVRRPQASSLDVVADAVHGALDDRGA